MTYESEIRPFPLGVTMTLNRNFFLYFFFRLSDCWIDNEGDYLVGT